MSLEGPKGPDLVQTASGWSNWVGHIHIMCFGPLRDLYGTPGAPRRARFGHEMPFGGPGGPQWALEDQMWSQLPPISPPGMESWPPYTLA